jgi:hypothetical protein
MNKRVTKQTATAYNVANRGGIMGDSKKSVSPKDKRGINCKNVFKDQNTIGDSLTRIWGEIIEILENTDSIAHNSAVQSHTHHNFEKDEVRN